MLVGERRTSGTSALQLGCARGSGGSVRLRSKAELAAITAARRAVFDCVVGRLNAFHIDAPPERVAIAIKFFTHADQRRIAALGAAQLPCAPVWFLHFG